jgi:GT2 family glycosyltransferase
MYHFSFVILHYEAINETIECVASIKGNLLYTNYSIVIVDNHSPNNSGKILKDKYQGEDNIFVLLNQQNGGFAKGNNEGYKFAKQNLRADFIACINNDTVIKDPEFVNKIIKLYEKEQYHVMGPDIIALNGIHQNPYRMKAVSLQEVNHYIKNYKKNLFIELFKVRLAQIKPLKIVVKKFLKNKAVEVNKNYEVAQENIVLHGAAVVFSPLYINSEEYAFHPGTFMYEEEQILYHLCQIKGYKILYSPITSIHHKEDASTNLTLKTNYTKVKFLHENILKSYFILKDILEKNKI